MTNYDRIKAMNLEEMASWMLGAVGSYPRRPCRYHPHDCELEHGLDDIGVFLDWLSSDKWKGGDIKAEIKVVAGDVVRVVRCKNCIWCEDHGKSGLYCNHPDNRNPCGCRAIDFCNNGQRKDCDICAHGL